MRVIGLVVAGLLAWAAPARAETCVKVKAGARLYDSDVPIGRTTSAVVMWWAGADVGSDHIQLDAVLVREHDGQRVVVGGLDSMDVKKADTHEVDCPPHWDEGADDAKRDGVSFIALEWRDGHEAGEIDRTLVASELRKRPGKDHRVCFHLRAIRGVDAEVCASPE
jgi:hypothetical protein